MNSYQLLTIVQSYAPDGDAQALVAERYRQEQADGASDDQLTLTLARVLADGLAFGNWPWVRPSATQIATV